MQSDRRPAGIDLLIVLAGAWLIASLGMMLIARDFTTHVLAFPAIALWAQAALLFGSWHGFLVLLAVPTLLAVVALRPWPRLWRIGTCITILVAWQAYAWSFGGPLLFR